jgi:hypothetical protein
VKTVLLSTSGLASFVLGLASLVLGLASLVELVETTVSSAISDQSRVK